MMCISVLTGCSLWERNQESYFEATVATITYENGDVEKISKRELITAFNSYGYNYVQNYGMNMEEAVKTTIDTIVEKYLTVRDVKKRYEANGEELLNEREKSYLWDSTYESIYSNLKSYLEDYKDDTATGDDQTTSASVFKDYESKIQALEKDSSGNWVIRKKESETNIRDTYPVHTDDSGYYDFEFEKDGAYPYQELMLKNILTMTNEKSWKVAYNKYLADIKDNYTYKRFKNDNEWFKFELNRVYEILRDNFISEKYETLHNSANNGISSTTANDILKAYSKRVRVDYENYVTYGNLSSFESSILSGVSDVDYIVEKKDNQNVGEYFFVAPIKINVEGLEALKTQRNNGEISASKYQEEVKALFDRNKQLVSVRNETTGEVESKISVNALYSMIQSDLSAQAKQKDSLRTEIGDLYDEMAKTSDETEIARLQTEIAEIQAEIDGIGIKMAESYRKYFYLYNDDDTNKGKDYNAVFGVDASGKAIVSDSYNNDAVKGAIETLYDNGNAQVGDISEVVQADDGFYIFFFAGKVENVFGVGADFDATNDKDNILALARTRLNIFSSKTLLDVLFDELDKNNFSVFQTMDMNNLRSQTKSIKIHKENIKDLYK